MCTSTLVDVFLPLLDCSPVQERYDDHRHIVKTNEVCIGLCCQTTIHHFLADLVQGYSVYNFLTDKFDDLFRGHAIPDAVAGQYQEFIVLCQSVLPDVGVS